jgi:hypothetical protein
MCSKMSYGSYWRRCSPTDPGGLPRSPARRGGLRPARFLERAPEQEDVLSFFKHFPLPIHQQAEAAALAGWCANRQEGFRFTRW